MKRISKFTFGQSQHSLNYIKNLPALLSVEEQLDFYLHVWGQEGQGKKQAEALRLPI